MRWSPRRTRAVSLLAVCLGLGGAAGPEADRVIVRSGQPMYRTPGDAQPAMIVDYTRGASFQVVEEREGWLKVVPASGVCAAAGPGSGQLAVPLWVTQDALAQVTVLPVERSFGGDTLLVLPGWGPPAEPTQADHWVAGWVPADAWGTRFVTTLGPKPPQGARGVDLQGWDRELLFGEGVFRLPTMRGVVAYTRRGPGARIVASWDEGCVLVTAGARVEPEKLPEGIVGGGSDLDSNAYRAFDQVWEQPPGTLWRWPDGEEIGRAQVAQSVVGGRRQGGDICGELVLDWGLELVQSRGPVVCSRASPPTVLPDRVEADCGDCYVRVTSEISASSGWCDPVAGCLPSNDTTMSGMWRLACETFEAQLPGLRACYGGGLVRSALLSGEVGLNVTFESEVGPPRVNVFRTTLFDPAVEQCMVRKLGEVRLPPGEWASHAGFSFTVRLHPELPSPGIVASDSILQKICATEP